MGNAGWIGLAVLVCGTPCAAQSAASLAINAGSATDVTGVGSNALTVAPSITRVSGLSSLTLGASATKFANDAWSAGIATSMTGRGHARAFAPVIDIALSAATTSYDFAYASVDLVPSLEAKAGAAKLFAGARLAAAGTSAMLTPPGGSPIPMPGGSRTTQSQTAAAAIGGVSVSTVARTGEIATIGYRAEGGTVAGARQMEHGLSATVASSRIMVGAAVGRRERVSQVATFGSATLGVAVTPVMMLQLSAGNYPASPMFGTAAGKFVNAGLTMRIGRRAGTLPEPAGVAAPAPGRTRVSIRASDATRVELAGDFNKWQSTAATRAGNGVWYADLQLPPGEYRYAFRIDGKEWRVPEGVAAVDDEFGGKSAWLTVSRSGTSPGRKK